MIKAVMFDPLPDGAYCIQGYIYTQDYQQLVTGCFTRQGMIEIVDNDGKIYLFKAVKSADQ